MPVTTAERQKLRDFLADNDLYLYTVNAFPYGPFKGRVVKEQVYEPDWRSEERTQYTINVADVLADVVDEDTAPSIQTAPLGFKPRVSGPDVVASYTEHLLRVVAHLVSLEERTGRTVTLAVEPEPYCFLETTDETVDYFSEHLYTGTAARALAELAGIPISEAQEPFGAISGSSSTSATRRWSTKTSARLCRNSSRPVFRSSSFRRRPRSTCPR